MRRRGYLRGVLAGGITSVVAGCLGGTGGSSGRTDGSSGGSGGTVDSLPAPVQGDPEAGVTVQVFEDYACPHCRQYEEDVLPKLEADYVDPGTIRYEHHDFPIPVDDRWSWVAASAARGVQDHVGDAAFFEYTHALFEHQSEYSLSLVASLAGDVGADGETIREAADAQTYRPVLEADRELGLQMGLDGTPEVYVDGEQTADHAYETIASAIENARS